MLKVQLLRPADWDDFYQLWEEVFRNDFLIHYQPERQKRLTKKLAEKNLRKDFVEKDRNFLVAKKGDHLVGFLLFKMKVNYSWASWIGVDKKWRGQKIGSKLIEKWQEICREKNLKLVKLQTSIEKSMNFYQKLGFKKTGLHLKEGLTFYHFEYKL
jgi:ribosomal protein S18 acetylase RimI-like enzyme